MVKPILFNTEMVCALLAGRKTVTRRVVKPQPETNLLEWLQQKNERKIPYDVGDILYVRETWTDRGDGSYMYKADYRENEKFYRGGKEVAVKWKPSLFMPKEAARIFLRVTNVSVTKLQDITTNDMQKEGLTSMAVFAGDKEIARQEWALLWNSTIPGKDYNKYCFSANPWVWVIEFERTEKPNGI